MKNITILFILFIQLAYASDTYYYKNNQKVPLTKNSDFLLRSNSTVDYYKNNRGIIMGVTDRLIVKLKDINELESYLSEFNLVKEKELGDNLFLLKTQNKNLTIEISNRLNEKESVEYAHPDFIKKSMRR